MGRFLIYLSLPFFLFFNSWLKIVYFGDARLFYSDSALRFRYARMIGEGEKVPVIDKKVCHPEGLRVRSLIHLTEDWVIGKSYLVIKRLCPTLPFSTYLKYFVSIFSSLSLLFLFLFAFAFWRNKTSAFLSSLFYAIGVPSFWRVTGNYLREEFALPFLFASLYFFFLARQRGKKVFLFGSGLSLTLGLISWHLSQFFFSLFVLFLLFLFFFDKESEKLFRSFPLFFLPPLIAGIFWEPLRTKYFLLSFPVLVCLWLWLITFLPESFRRFLVFLPLPFYFLLLRLFPGYFQEYAHVFEVIFYKIIYFGKKPEDPSLLSFAARSIWMGPFSSPGFLSFAFALLIPFLLGLIGFLSLIRSSFNGERHFPFFFLTYFFLLFTFLYLLVIRLEVFLFFFLSLAIGGNGLLLAKKRWVVIILLLGLLWEGYKAINYPRLFSRYYLSLAREWRTKPTAYGLDWESLSAWFKKMTKPEEAVLADIDLSAMVLTYLDRPIVIQPIYESESARKRVLECLNGFFKDEEEFFSLINRYKVSYVIYEKGFLLDNSSEGVRYLTNNLRVKKNSVVYLMHFFPESLVHFSLVHQTNTFRVYAVLPAKASAPRRRVFPYSPYFDLSLFPQVEGNPDWEDKGTREVERKVIGSIAKYNQAVALMERKEYQKAIPLLSGILAIFPELERANYYLGECLRQVGEKEKAVAYFDRSIANNPEDWPSYIAKVYLLDERDQLPEAVRTVISALSIDPNQKEFYSLLGYLYLRRNKRLEGINKFLELANLFPHTPFPHLYCGYLYAENNDLEKAEREFIKAKEKNPEEADVYSALGSLYLQKGEKERARAFFQKSLSLNPNQPALLKTLQSRDQVLPDKEGRPMP